MKKIYTFLKIHGKNIASKACKDNLEMKIINSYEMHYRCPGDPGAQGILYGLIESYKTKEGL